MTIWYAYIVWGRIPFAACNLVTATTAVRGNLGLSVLAYSSLPLMLGWSAWWMLSFASTIYVTSGCDGQGNCQGEANGFVIFLMLLSFHWTSSVIRNTVHVTVAGVGKLCLVRFNTDIFRSSPYLSNMFRLFSLFYFSWYMVVCSNRGFQLLLQCC